MSLNNQPRPGEIKFTLNSRQQTPIGAESPLRNTYRATGNSNSPAAGLALALLLLIAGSFGSCTGSDTGNGGGNGGGGSASSYSSVSSPSGGTPPFRSASRSMLGKYAAFIQHKPHEKPTAVVFTYEKILLVMVASESEIPGEDLDAAIHYPANFQEDDKSAARVGNRPDAFSSFMKEMQPSSSLEPNHPFRFPAFSPHPNQTLQHRSTGGSQPSASLDNQLENTDWSRPPPYVLHGDVSLDIGPLVNRDQMIAQLVLQHGDLKAASITIVEGAPRGPPRGDQLVNGGGRIIYVVGQVTHMNGPLQKDRSVLNAYTIDLGPDARQFYNFTVDEEQSLPSDPVGSTYVPEDGNHRVGREETHEASHPAESPAIP